MCVKRNIEVTNIIVDSWEEIQQTVQLCGLGGILIGEHVRIDDFVVLVSATPTSNIILEEGVHISGHCGIRSHSLIRIKANTTISAGCQIFGRSDAAPGQKFRYNVIHHEELDEYSSDIIIGENCLIGANSVLLPGTVIPDNTFIGACSLVDKELDKSGLWVGQPVRFIR